VLDFGVRSGTVAAARETAYALSFTHNATLQSTVPNVEQSYYTYVGARAVLDAALLSVREAQASYQAAWKKDSLGLATIADVLQSRTALAQARLALDTAQVAVQTSRATLAVAFGARATLQFDGPSRR
jgi:outer membrane protein TolC